MFKRSQKAVSEGSKHWYQDRYQHVLTQRNILALIAIVALVTAALAALAVMRIAPLKTVEPYLVEIDEKSGITQRVDAYARKNYVDKEAVDRYFVSTYLRARESYNPSIYRYNFNLVRLMSTPSIFSTYRRQVDPASDSNPIKMLMAGGGQRDVRVRSMVYIVNPADRGQNLGDVRSRMIQVRLITTDTAPNVPAKTTSWRVDITFEYAQLKLNEEEQFINPLGFTVTRYQIQPELE